MHKTTATIRPRYTRRRGSMIVLAIGVLAVLAIVALSYTAAVRVERTGVQSFVNRIDGERQVDAVLEEIQALLTADLFGNKIVTGETPRYTFPNAGVGMLTSVWPRLFEDGEYFDVPGVDNASPLGGLFTFNTELLGDPPSVDSVLDIENGAIRYSPAITQDDAWLGATEPVNASASLNGVWDTWPTITNLRSAYRWVLTGPNSWAWVRGDGKFADLAQWFLSEEAERSERGDPDADLTAFDDPLTGFENGPILGVNQQVYEYQMSAMQELVDGFNPDADEPLPLTNADGRYWADTDGDLRPDARWQTLESFGNLNGLRWVAAVRIIDNSSMVNANTSLLAGRIDSTIAAPNSPYDDVGAGRTPADVDLLRLMRTARFRSDLVTVGGSGWGDLVPDANQWRMPENGPNGSWIQYGSATGSYDNLFREQHIESQLRLHDAVNGFNLNYDNNNNPYDDYDPFAFVRPLRRYERELLYYAALDENTGHLGAGYGHGYTIENEADLRAYWGVNREDTLSQLEQRLDAGYLPQQSVPGVVQFDSDTGAQLEQGPLHSADRQRHARGYSLTGRELGAGNFELRPTFAEIRDDLRRHITTVSGSSYLSPVPVINDAVEGMPPNERAVYGDRAPNLKVSFSEFPTLDSPTSVSVGKTTAVERAFETLVWALAPMATDQPIAASITPIQVGINAQPHGYHYGGGASNVGNPAAAMVTAGAEEPNSTYALIRAASLAVNLADAIDDSAIADTDPTRDAPTIARLYPQSVTRESLVGVPQTTLDAMDDAGMPILTTRFSHGDIPGPQTVPAGPPLQPRYVGQPATGVTLVGLDRQPFLREVASLALYRDDLLIPASVDPPANFDGEIRSARLDEQLGSIIAFEVGNPWPHPLSVKDYALRLTTEDGGRWMQLDLRFLADADAVIAPGGYAVFYIYRANPMWQADWDAAFGAWQTDVQAKFGASAVQFLGFNADDPASPSPVTFDALPPGAVMFQDWTLGGDIHTRALILHNDEFDMDDPIVLVDRMSAPPGAEPFPAVMDDLFGGVFTIVPDDLGGPAGMPTAGTGRLGVASSFTRRTRPAVAGAGAGPEERIGGFPAYVIERPEGGNDVSAAQGAENTWGVGASQLSAVELINVGAPGNNLGPGPAGGGDVPKGDLPGLPSFQFFVPNHRLETVGDLAMLGAFTHMYVHGADDMPMEAWAPANADVLATLPLIRGVPEAGRWVTIGEQLGADIHFTYNAQPVAASPSNANPYLGVLDPTRFVLTSPGATVPGDLAAIVGLPDSLAVPLATRVFDGFEALGQPSRGHQLAAGRINVNTAPRRVLRMIPFMSPEQTIQWPTPNMFDGSLSGLLDVNGSPDPTYLMLLQNDQDRAGLLSWYRDGRLSGATIGDRSFRTNINGLRSIGLAGRPSDGITAAGELEVMALWEVSNSAPTPTNPTLPGGTYSHFGELGQRVDPTLGTRRNTGVAHPPLLATIPPNGPKPSHFEMDAGQVDGVLDRYPNAIMEIEPGVTANLDPLDDAEERSAIYRAMSNIVSTRSDVFTAWIVIRGYDPARISTIPFPQNFDPGSPDPDELAALMNQLTPAHESRWLAVFDRSNVRTPTDRPKVLLLTRLPTR